MDSSKFDLVRPSYFAAPGDINIRITDSGISREWRKTVTDLGIDLRIADE